MQAASLNGAMKAIGDVMGGTMIDYDAVSMNSTKIMDVYEYKKTDGDGKE